MSDFRNWLDRVPARQIRQFAAWLLGYFWLPCPICGRDFAGYETGHVSVPRPGTPNRKVACYRHEASIWEGGSR